MKESSSATRTTVAAVVAACSSTLSPGITTAALCSMRWCRSPLGIVRFPSASTAEEAA